MKECNMKLTYRLPELGDERLLREYLEEHYTAGEKSVSASMRLPVTPFEEWVEQMKKNAEEGNEAWGKSHALLCFDEERLVGLLSVRWELTEALSWTIGDIGYGVRPSERGKGYATEMLKHGLNICREKGLKNAVIGCYKDNVASARVILKNSGVLVREADDYEKGRMSQYYTISL